MAKYKPQIVGREPDRLEGKQTILLENIVSERELRGYLTKLDPLLAFGKNELDIYQGAASVTLKGNDYRLKKLAEQAYNNNIEGYSMIRCFHPIYGAQFPEEINSEQFPEEYRELVTFLKSNRELWQKDLPKQRSKDCPEPETVAEYVHAVYLKHKSQISDSEKEAIKKHLEKCDFCFHLAANVFKREREFFYGLLKGKSSSTKRVNTEKEN